MFCVNDIIQATRNFVEEQLVQREFEYKDIQKE